MVLLLLARSLRRLNLLRSLSIAGYFGQLKMIHTCGISNNNSYCLQPTSDGLQPNSNLIAMKMILVVEVCRGSVVYLTCLATCW